MTSDNSSERMLSAKEVATRLECSTGTVYNMLHNGTLRGINLNHKCIKIPESEVSRILNQWQEVNPIPVVIPIIRKDIYAEKAGE